MIVPTERRSSHARDISYTNQTTGRSGRVGRRRGPVCNEFISRRRRLRPPRRRSPRADVVGMRPTPLGARDRRVPRGRDAIELTIPLNARRSSANSPQQQSVATRDSGVFMNFGNPNVFDSLGSTPGDGAWLTT